MLTTFAVLMSLLFTVLSVVVALEWVTIVITPASVWFFIFVSFSFNFLLLAILSAESSDEDEDDQTPPDGK